LADDVAQDAFERAFERLASFDPERSFGAWLHRIVVNRALDVLRRERRLVPSGHIRESVNEEPRGLEDRPLAISVAALSSERRVVVVLRYWLDFSPAEIAEILGVPVGTVSSRLTRALSELRLELEANHVGRN
jgi:RNA polymerase sigma-70 factor (ECF subfamily)